MIEKWAAHDFSSQDNLIDRIRELCTSNPQSARFNNAYIIWEKLQLVLNCEGGRSDISAVKSLHRTSKYLKSSPRETRNAIYPSIDAPSLDRGFPTSPEISFSKMH